MKRIINGRKYDTKTAKPLADTLEKKFYLLKLDESEHCEELYRKENGGFFIYSRDVLGVADDLAEDLEDDSKFEFNKRILPQTEGAARDWVESEFNERYEQIFGEVKE